MASIGGAIPARALRAVAVIGIGAGLPAIADAGRGDTSRNFADKLRYGPGVANHPVNVVPSKGINIPQGWPVEANGSITCLTCHTTLPALDGSTEPHLRDHTATGADHAHFCQKCHASSQTRTNRSMHWQAMPNAHIKRADSTSTRSGPTLDGQSQRCLGCHDGVSAKETRNTLGSSIVGAGGGSGRSHPIGMQYTGVGLGRSRSNYTPAKMLPPQVQLPEGVVSCVSCHNLYAQDRYLLAVPIEGSALCFTCHSMK